MFTRCFSPVIAAFIRCSVSLCVHSLLQSCVAASTLENACAVHAHVRRCLQAGPECATLPCLIPLTNPLLAGGTWLYDVVNDPFETTDLASSLPDVVAAIQVLCAPPWVQLYPCLHTRARWESLLC